MPKATRYPSKITIALAIIILAGLGAAAGVYITFALDKSIAAQEVWGHFKALSTFVVGYFFGTGKYVK
ncbi:hypothetical protein [Agaribacterium haliotis]|uniref:hypothetical protein n=1 Tax=Agaribacterium haliotis TaxID=2013869 RepID=UPI000BB595B0|nr:hypothetical protein [Agaribacterium haliotis]